MERPIIGRVYFAPVSLAAYYSPLVSGERRGVVVDEPSQDAAVVYTTRAAAVAALADPAVWNPDYAKRFRVARVRYVGRAFGWANVDERDAHLDACEFEYCERCSAPHLSVNDCATCSHVCSANCGQRRIARREAREAQMPLGVVR